MKKSMLAIGLAVLAVAALPAANASEDTEYERAGWAALEAASQARAKESAAPASVWASDFNFIAPAP